MHSEIAIDIAAPAASVFALARDVERWPDLLPHYVAAEVGDRRSDGSLVVDFIARRPFVPILGLSIPVTWRSRTWSEPAHHRLRFVHLAGATRGMDVTWRIEPTGDGSGCHVTIEHAFDPPIPGFAAFVDRWFTRPIAGRTLATFRAVAEAVQSVAPATTNSST